jgi:hypothetical protein
MNAQDESALSDTAVSNKALYKNLLLLLLISELRNDVQKFRNFTRMHPNTFDMLVDLIGNNIIKSVNFHF